MGDPIPVTTHCSQCGFENPRGFAFCGQCATPLTGQTPAFESLQTENTDKPEDKAERRQLTVMFCDLVGSTALSEQLDPEDLREVMLAYRGVSARVINRFEGYIAQYLGDGLLVYFGYPVAHEDDARRAVRTGLGIVEAIEYLNPSLEQERGLKLAVRVGIHTGLVVAGDMGSGEQLQPMAVVGETPNVASRIQGLAEPNSVVISPATHRLIQGYFDCRSLGLRTLKGISQPVEAFRVLSETTAKTRLDVAAATGLTPLVGREEELALILSRWEQVKEGRGEVVLLSGEAGIGKSRLVHRLKELIAQEPGAWLTPCQCLAYFQNSALYPLIDLLERLVLGFESNDSPQQKLSKLQGWLVQYGFSLPDTLPLFASLLSIPLGEAHAPLNLSPEQLKHKTFQALVTALLRRAAQQPLLFVMEDLHWADPSTLELMSLVLDQVPATRMFVLLTFRPEFTPPWGTHFHLALSRLPHKQTETMIEQLMRGKALPPEVLEQLIVKTDGVPLFVEELTKMIVESGLLQEREDRYELMGPLPPLAIPTTLQDSLVARLDRLATVKEVMQLGATLGQEFIYDLLKAVSWLDEETLQKDLSRLVEAELLYQSGFPPQARYIFKHALIQDTAYQQMLKSKRQQYHQRIAQVLERQFLETVDTQPELLAHHYTEAGLLEQAIPYWQRAGRRAIERSANAEAESHLTKGIELLKHFEETPERLLQELELQGALGPVLQAIKGWTSPETERTYSRARELCGMVGETPQLFLILHGIWYYYGMRPEVPKAIELAEQLLTLAENAQDSSLLLVAYRTLGAISTEHGDLLRGLGLLKQGVAIYDPEEHRSLAFVYGQDIGVVCRQWSAWALWLLGYPDQAKKTALETIQMAHETSHALTLAYVLYFSAHFYQLRREIGKAKQLAEQGVQFSTDQGFPAFGALSNMVMGTLAENEDIDAGIARARASIDAFQTAGSGLLVPYHLNMVADAHRRAGRAEQGLAVVTEGLAIAERGGEHVWDADLYRVRGELLLLDEAHASDAEACFHTALEVARRQGAKSYELRTGVSLSRLWQQQGKREEARKLLSEIYSWFTEGFDTVDLQEARALLESLS